MAEYGKLLPPKKTKPSFLKEVSLDVIISFILIAMIVMKIIFGGLTWMNLLLLILFALPLITVVDSIKEDRYVRYYTRNWKDGIFDTYCKHERPFMYWQSVITSWIFAPIFAISFFLHISLRVMTLTPLFMVFLSIIESSSKSG